MTEKKLRHPRRLYLFHLCSMILFWGAVMAWLFVFISGVILHTWIVPRIGDYKTFLEQTASNSIGIPVKIGRLSAKSEGWLPTFLLEDVQLRDNSGQTGLQLGKVTAVLSPRSLFSLDFERLTVDSPSLEIRRSQNGNFWIAGIEVKPSSDIQSSSPLLDWFFSQNNFEINKGQIKFIDEKLRPIEAPLNIIVATNSQKKAYQSQLPSISKLNTATLSNGPEAMSFEFKEVHFSSRNPLHKHHLTFSAVPPANWGQKITLMGEFSQSLIYTDRANFKRWEGQIFADLPYINAEHISPYLPIHASIKEGKGSARAWIDMDKLQAKRITADIATQAITIQFKGTPDPLALQSIKGRVEFEQLDNGLSISTQNLRFQTADGLNWPQGNIKVTQIKNNNRQAETGHLDADQIDLAIVSQIASRLPLGDSIRQQLLSLKPSGQLMSFNASYEGPIEKPTQLTAKGKLQNLSMQAQATDKTDDVTRPGVEGASIDFDFDLTKGNADLRVEKGKLHFPGVWEDPTVAVDQLSAQLKWKITDQPYGQHIQIDVEKGVIKNADASGKFSGTWQTSDPRVSNSHSRFPGNLQLDARLDQANGARVWRYLPQSVGKDAIDYVKYSILSGTAKNAHFVIKGDLFDLPYDKTRNGTFKIDTQVENATMAYVPKQLQNANELAWPSFSNLSGDLIFDGASMEVRNAKAFITDNPNLKITSANVKIADLSHSVVQVKAQAVGPLSNMLNFTNNSPLRDLTEKALSHAKATGNSEYIFNMNLPIDQLDHTTLEGQVKLAGNDLQISPDTPTLKRVNGTVVFNEDGFLIQSAKASLLGGEIEFSGGSTNLLNQTFKTNAQLKNSTPASSNKSSVKIKNSNPEIVIKGKGIASAQGLAATTELGVVSQLAKSLNGSTSYNLSLHINKGQPELIINSYLVGIASQLPAPFNKTADSSWPLSYENLLTPSSATLAINNPNVVLQDTIKLEIGNLLHLFYLRNLPHNSDVEVVRGSIGIGLAKGESAPQPAVGIAASIVSPQISLDKWLEVFKSLKNTNINNNVTAKSASIVSNSSHPSDDYLPRLLTVKSNQIVWDNYSFEQVYASLIRDGNVWRATIDSKELAGFIEYKTSANDAKLFARLNKAFLANANQEDVEQVLDQPSGPPPSVDIEIDNFQLAGKTFGKIQLDANNRILSNGSREWKINKLVVQQHFAKLSATGSWAEVAKVGSFAKRPLSERRRMDLDFKLEIDNAGDLVTWIGKEKALRNGKGKLEGTIGWQGSPFQVNLPTLRGQMNLSVQNGQFLKIDMGAAKLLSVLSLQALPRRLILDFRDVFTDGFAFDTIKGDITVAKGVASTQNLQMNGMNALVLMDGSADIVNESQNLHIVVIPEISAGGAALAFAAVNPAVGLSSLLAQWLISKPLMEAATREYFIQGSWSSPTVTEVKRGSKLKPSPNSNPNTSTPAGSTDNSAPSPLPNPSS